MSSVHSEVLVVIGAGATQQLGMPQTSKQTKIIRELSEENAIYESILKSNFKGENLSKVISFLRILDGNEDDKSNLDISENDLFEIKKIYKNCKDENILKRRILELRRDYNWNALKKIIKICPKKESEDNLIRDVYSIIDKKLLAHQSIKVTEEDSLPVSHLQGARNFLTLFINMMFASAWFDISDGEKDSSFNKYLGFIKSFGNMMRNEGHNFYERGFKVYDRDFYLFSCSFISLNFEMVFPWILMNTHKELNTNNRTYIQDHPMKLWLDYGVEHRGRKLDKKTGKIVPTLEFTESVASRENEDEHAGTELNRAGKFYFAHGSSNWRECPVCGRMTFYNGGNNWFYKSKKLISPFPIPIFENEIDGLLTEKEKKWRKESLHYDSMECMHCGAETFAYSAPMIMQTLYKSTPTSFLEEIQRNVRVSLEKALHIVLLGYQLPPDDIVWQQTFAEAIRSRLDTKNEAYCTVVVGYNGEKRWLYDEDLKKYVDTPHKKEELESYGIPAIENAWAIFGEERVRAWTGGIPDVFGEGTESDVKELLYPDFVKWEGTRLDIEKEKENVIHNILE